MWRGKLTPDGRWRFALRIGRLSQSLHWHGNLALTVVCITAFIYNLLFFGDMIYAIVFLIGKFALLNGTRLQEQFRCFSNNCDDTSKFSSGFRIELGLHYTIEY